eukprot:COSAG02_NODE_8976_length_2375_cov_1.067223_3_plen_116_part_00
MYVLATALFHRLLLWIRQLSDAMTSRGQSTIHRACVVLDQSRDYLLEQNAKQWSRHTKTNYSCTSNTSREAITRVATVTAVARSSDLYLMPCAGGFQKQDQNDCVCIGIVSNTGQ